MRWSITENQVKPCSSAHPALACTASQIPAGSAQNSQDGLWMPNFMQVSSFRPYGVDTSMQAPLLSPARARGRMRGLYELWKPPHLASRPSGGEEIELCRQSKNAVARPR